MSDSWAQPYEENLSSETIVMPVEGYRIWYKPIETVFLRSYYIQANWIPGQKMVAECQNHMACVCSEFEFARNEFDRKYKTCNAGVYAFKTFDQAYEMWRDELEKLLSTDAPEPVQNRLVVGKVYLWGKVIECVKGFRGQYAYPAGFYYTADNSPSLATLYNVPLLAMKDHNRAHYSDR